MMSDSLRIILALCLVAGALFGEKVIDAVKNNVEIVNDPVVSVDEPSLEYKELVKPITDLDISADDAKMLSAFYLEMADVIEKDNGAIGSTGEFRNFNMMAGLLHFNTSLKDKYDTLGEDIDLAIVETIGKQSVSLEDKREDLVSVLEAIAWSVNK
jgi:hypothetical protein